MFNFAMCCVGAEKDASCGEPQYLNLFVCEWHEGGTKLLLPAAYTWLALDVRVARLQWRSGAAQRTR